MCVYMYVNIHVIACVYLKYYSILIFVKYIYIIYKFIPP